MGGLGERSGVIPLYFHFVRGYNRGMVGSKHIIFLVFAVLLAACSSHGGWDDTGAVVLSGAGVSGSPFADITEPYFMLTDAYRVPFEDFCVDLGNPSGGKFCVSIKPNGRYCEPWPEDDGEEKKIYKHEPGYGPWSPVDANNRFVFFSDSQSGGPFRVGACERGTLKEYTIIETDATVVLYYAVDQEHFVLDVNTNDSDTSFLYYINLNTGDLKTVSIGEYRYQHPKLSYPFLAMTKNDYDIFHIYNLETGTMVAVEGLQGSFGPAAVFKNNTLLVDAAIGYGEESTDQIDGPLEGPNIFKIDPATGVFEPVVVTVGRYNSASHIDAGRWALFTTGRNSQYVGTFTSAGDDVYLLDMKTKRETLISSSRYGNNCAIVLEYPYVGWTYSGDPSTYIGVHFIQNVETGEIWKFIGQGCDSDAILYHRMLYYTVDLNGVIAAKLPALPLYPDDDSFCDDGNPCTDDRYFVTGRRCLNEPNRDQCDDGDLGTPFDFCHEGICTGYRTEPDSVKEIVLSNNLFMDQYEVTQERYRKCVDAGVCNPPARTDSFTREHYWDDPAYNNYPVIYVTYFDAKKYCAWRGKRLPNLMEARSHANPYDYDRENDPRLGDTAEVGSYDKDYDSLGVYDLAANVAEWTSGRFTYHFSNHPKLDFGEQLVMVSSGSWYRESQPPPTTPWSTNSDLGFRCVRDAK